MCTGISAFQDTHYFGRSLDISVELPFEILITPRNYSFSFIPETVKNSYSLIGMGMEVSNYPFYFDAMNEMGVGMAGLNFPGFAFYDEKEQTEKINLAPYELIQFLLKQVSSVQEAKTLLEKIHLVNRNFNQDMPISPLHWLLSDGKETIVIENTKEGLHVYDNPYAILTNNPPFPYHCYNVENYLHLTPQYPKNNFSKNVLLKPNSVGLGAVGLPGDNSSSSRFIRGFYHLSHLKLTADETANVVNFFHVLDGVIQVKGTSYDELGQSEFSAYFSCMSEKTKTYYVRTYDNPQIQQVTMTTDLMEGKDLISFPLERKLQFKKLN